MQPKPLRNRWPVLVAISRASQFGKKSPPILAVSQFDPKVYIKKEMKPETFENALEIAKHAADWLREKGATRILLFGSLADGAFTPKKSDIDLYFEGLSDKEALGAAGYLLDAFGEDSIDPIPAQFCSPRFKATIIAEGVTV